MKNLDEVKKDLKNLKKASRIIEKLYQAEATHLKRIKMLEALPKTEGVLALIEKEREHILSLKIETAVNDARIIEEKYMSQILKLDPIDKGIIIDNYINGIPCWKIGAELGYTEDGVRKRISKIMKIFVSNT